MECPAPIEKAFLWALLFPNQPVVLINANVPSFPLSNLRVVPCLELYFPPRFMIFFKSDFRCFRAELSFQTDKLKDPPIRKVLLLLKAFPEFCFFPDCFLCLTHHLAKPDREFLFFLTASPDLFLLCVISPVCLSHRLQDYSNQVLLCSIPASISFYLI